MKKFRVFVMLAVVFFSVSCATKGDWTPPPGCEDSLILANIGNVREVDMVLKLVNVRALRSDVYKQSEALRVLETLKDLVEYPSVTYQEIALKVLNDIGWLNNYFGIEIMIASEYIATFKDAAIEISQCDRDLMLGHLESQIKYTKILGNE